MAQSAHHKLPSITDTFHRALDIFVNHTGKIVGTSFIPQVIAFFLISSFSFVVLTGLQGLADGESFFQVSNIYFLIASAIAAMFFVIQGIGAVATTYMVVHHERVSITHAFTRSMKFYKAFLLQFAFAIIITLVAIVVGYFFVLLAGVIMGNFSLELYADALSLLTVIPTITGGGAATLVAFAGFLIVDEAEHGGFASVKESIKMVRPFFWPLFFRIFIFGVLSTVLTLLFLLVPYLGRLLTLLTVIPFAVVYLYVLYTEVLKASK